MSARNRSKSDSVSTILNPVNGVREEMIRRGITPKDHHKENLKMIRETQRAKKEISILEQQKQDTESVFKLEQFQNIDSVVKKQIEESRQRHSQLRTTTRRQQQQQLNGDQDRGDGGGANDDEGDEYDESGHPYLKAHSREEKIAEKVPDKPYVSNKIKTKAPIPTASELAAARVCCCFPFPSPHLI